MVSLVRSAWAGSQRYGAALWSGDIPADFATLRAQVFLCGALLGRAGRRLVLHLSTSWGGLQQRIPLLENILLYGLPTSPKFNPQTQT